MVFASFGFIANLVSVAKYAASKCPTFQTRTVEGNTRNMKADFNHIEKEVKKAIMKYKWEFLGSKYDEVNFGNWIIEFKNSSFKLRLVNDRGDVMTQVYDRNDWQPGEDFFKKMKIETVAYYLENNDNHAKDDIFQYLSQILMHLNALQPVIYK